MLNEKMNKGENISKIKHTTKKTKDRKTFWKTYIRKVYHSGITGAIFTEDNEKKICLHYF